MYSLSVMKSMATGSARGQKLCPLFSWPNNTKSFSALAPKLGLARPTGIVRSRRHLPQARAFRTYEGLREDNIPQKDMATKSDIDMLRKEIEGYMKDLRYQMTNMQAELIKELTELCVNVEGNLNSLNETGGAHFDTLKQYGIGVTNAQNDAMAHLKRLQQGKNDLSMQLKNGILELSQKLLAKENTYLVGLSLFIGGIAVGTLSTVGFQRSNTHAPEPPESQQG